jgi:tRNA(Arg) A34 adenosine deaminase TadA
MSHSTDFETLVQRHVLRLQSRPLGEIEREVAAKRCAWLERERPRLTARLADQPLRPRRAFELLFFDYMGLAERDLPILADTPSEIAWSSENPCLTLDACGRLGLDTRVVCRRVYEKPTQAFLSAIDPELRFVRDYRTIRPHAPACRERIVRIEFAAMMRLAIAEARRSRREGNKGYGAVVALGDRVLAQAHDTAVTEGDPSLHAEVNAIRAAVRATGDADLCGAILFSTCEPCPMCVALAVWANLTTIVFGASIAETAAQGKARIRIPARDMVARGPAMIELVPGVLAAECLALYE